MRSRFVAFLRRCPELDWISSRSFPRRCSRSRRSRIERIASAPMPASNTSPKRSSSSACSASVRIVSWSASTGSRSFSSRFASGSYSLRTSVRTCAICWRSGSSSSNAASRFCCAAASAASWMSAFFVAMRSSIAPTCWRVTSRSVVMTSAPITSPRVASVSPRNVCLARSFSPLRSCRSCSSALASRIVSSIDSLSSSSAVASSTSWRRPISAISCSSASSRTAILPELSPSRRLTSSSISCCSSSSACCCASGLTDVIAYCAKYSTRSSARGATSSSRPSRLGTPLANQMCATGAARLMCPMRSRRTLLRATSTPHLSQTMPL